MDNATAGSIPTTVTARTQAERTALSDARMLAAATRLIVERGTARTTLKDVGEQAGYSRGLAGYRFGSKGGLFSFVVKAIGDEWLQELKQVTAGKVGLAALTAATDAHYRFCVDAPEQVRAFYLLWFESISPGSEVREVIAGIHQRRQRDVEHWIKLGIDQGVIGPGVDAAAIAGQFCAAIIGIVYQWLVHPAALDEVSRLYQDLKASMASLIQTQSTTREHG